MRFTLNNRGTIVKGSLYSIFSFFNKGVGFVLLVILANFIAPTEYGQLSLFNTVLMFLGYFIALSSEGYVEISYFKDGKNIYTKDITFLSLLPLSIFGFLLIILTLFKDFISGIIQLPYELIVCAMIISFLGVYMKLGLSYYRFTEKIINYGLLSCGFAICNFGLSLLFVITLQKNWIGRIYAEFLAYAIVSSVIILYFTRHNLFGFPVCIKRGWKAIKWGIPLIPHLATTWLRQGCDRYIINYNYSLSDVGLFSFALNVANIIEAIGSAFNSTNSISIFKILSDKQLSTFEKKQQLGRQTKLIFLIYLVASSLVMLFGVIFIPILLPKYSDAIPYFIILSGYGFLRCVYFLYCNYLFYWSKTKELMYITFVSSIAHLSLSFFLTKYSLYVTTSIYVFTQLIISILVIIKAKRLITEKL